jgi:hypothetical protein
MRSAASWTVAMFSAPPSPIDTPNCSSKAIIISTWSYLQCLYMAQLMKWKCQAITQC